MLLGVLGLLLRMLGHRMRMRLRLQERLQEWLRVRRRRMLARVREILVTLRGWLLVQLLWPMGVQFLMLQRKH